MGSGLISFAPMEIREDYTLWLKEPEVEIQSAMQYMNMEPCSKHHLAPTANCFCGIHTTLSRKFWDNYIATLHNALPEYPVPIIGTFYVCGTVIFEDNLNIRSKNAMLYGMTMGYLNDNINFAADVFHKYHNKSREIAQQRWEEHRLKTIHPFFSLKLVDDVMRKLAIDIKYSYLDETFFNHKFQKVVPGTFKETPYNTYRQDIEDAFK